MRQKPNKSLENGADFVRYDAILFDLDGTLTESEPGILNSVQYSLEQMSVRGFERRQLRAFIGPPLYEAFREIVGLDDQEAKRAIAIFRERFERVGWAENSVYTGIPRLLRSLKAAGAYVAVATSKPAKFAGRILEHFGLMGCIDRVCAVSLSENHAEKAELIRHALPGRFERAVMVGDRKFDMQGGRENGIEVIGALYGYGSREELLPYAPEGMAESVDELQNLLLGDEKPARGVFISLEGTDGCGKSTQIPLLQQWLERCGEVVCLTREPGGCPISERIREIILDVNHREMTDVCEAYLYAAARAQHVRQRILPALQRGEIVLCDRYLDSSLAYQGAGRGLGMEKVEEINRVATEGLLPDLTLFYDLDPERAMERRRAASPLDRLEMAEDGFMRRTYEGFKALMDREGKTRFVRLDADQGIEALQTATQAAVRSWMNQK